MTRLSLEQRTEFVNSIIDNFIKDKISEHDLTTIAYYIVRKERFPNKFCPHLAEELKAFPQAESFLSRLNADPGLMTPIEQATWSTVLFSTYVDTNCPTMEVVNKNAVKANHLPLLTGMMLVSVVVNYLQNEIYNLFPNWRFLLKDVFDEAINYGETNHISPHAELPREISNKVIYVAGMLKAFTH